MSSYDSNASGYLHGQYYESHHQAPPYPTTPRPCSSSAQGYFPQQQQDYSPMHRRSTSEYSTSPHDSGSGNRRSSQDHKHGHAHGQLDADTEREYERRYARERRMERRPTLGGSLLSVLDSVGKKAFGGSSGRH